LKNLGRFLGSVSKNNSVLVLGVGGNTAKYPNTEEAHYLNSLKMHKDNQLRNGAKRRTNKLEKSD